MLRTARSKFIGRSVGRVQCLLPTLTQSTGAIALYNDMTRRHYCSPCHSSCESKLTDWLMQQRWRSVLAVFGRRPLFHSASICRFYWTWAKSGHRFKWIPVPWPWYALSTQPHQTRISKLPQVSSILASAIIMTLFPSWLATSAGKIYHAPAAAATPQIFELHQWQSAVHCLIGTMPGQVAAPRSQRVRLYLPLSYIILA